jgi:thiamine-phosphate pyrophosphorylase
MWSNIQFISQGNTAEEQLVSVKSALDAGCKWIQLRFKQADEAMFLTVGKQVKMWCESAHAHFIVNDYDHLVEELGADGVHLGLADTSVAMARSRLGSDAIIGGTANTLEEVLQRVEENCDYIGLGPLRFTTTKENLSPILGLTGYQTILQALEKRHISIPIVAIGGIELADVEPLMKLGISGIAVSGLLTTASDKRAVMNELHQKTGNNVTNWR